MLNRYYCFVVEKDDFFEVLELGDKFDSQL